MIPVLDSDTQRSVNIWIAEWLEFPNVATSPFPEKLYSSKRGVPACSVCELIFPHFTHTYYLYRSPETRRLLSEPDDSFRAFYRCPCRCYGLKEVAQIAQEYLRAQGWRRRGVFVIPKSTRLHYTPQLEDMRRSINLKDEVYIPSRDAYACVADCRSFRYVDARVSVMELPLYVFSVDGGDNWHFGQRAPRLAEWDWMIGEEW